VTLFSLLFGIGLEAQRERIDGCDRHSVRRLVFLLVVGLARLFAAGAWRLETTVDRNGVAPSRREWRHRFAAAPMNPLDSPARGR